MAIHNIEPISANLHGRFSRDLPPIMSIDSGDSVIYRTLDAGWGVEPHASVGGERRTFEPRDKELDRGHALCGPIEIRGARPGMTLEISIEEVRPDKWGTTFAGGWNHEVNRYFGVTEDKDISWLLWELDTDTMTGRNQLGLSVALHPFMGVMGMPANEPGVQPTAPPRFCGGNIDCKELVAGTTLYLPIAVEGGLFSVGDGHAAQGDGESSITAIECPMERVKLTFRLNDDLHINSPRARVHGGWLTLGFHEDLDQAAFMALEAMLQLMNEQYGLKRLDALAMASVVVDLRVTQIVNGVKGVHAMLADGAIRR